MAVRKRRTGFFLPQTAAAAWVLVTLTSLALAQPAPPAPAPAPEIWYGLQRVDEGARAAAPAHPPVPDPPPPPTPPPPPASLPALGQAPPAAPLPSREEKQPAPSNPAAETPTSPPESVTPGSSKGSSLQPQGESEARERETLESESSKSSEESVPRPHPLKRRHVRHKVQTEPTSSKQEVVPAASWTPAPAEEPLSHPTEERVAPPGGTVPALLPESLTAVTPGVGGTPPQAQPTPLPPPHEERPPAAEARAAAPVPTREERLPPPERTGQEVRLDQLVYQTALIQFIGIVATLVLMPLLLALILVVVVRRNLGKRGSLLHVEVINTHGSVAGVPAAPGPPSAPSLETVAGPPRMSVPMEVVAGPELLPVEPERPEEITAEPFELGPTYEEEQRLREEAARQQGEGLLRHIFEQNLQLRRQITGTP